MKLVFAFLLAPLLTSAAPAADLYRVAAAASLATGHFPEEWFLTHGQFAALTPSEQMNYVAQLKKIMSSLSARSRVFATAVPTAQRRPAGERAVTAADAENMMSQYKAWRKPTASDSVDAVEQSAWYLVTARQLASQIAEPSIRRLYYESIDMEQDDVLARAGKLGDKASSTDAARLRNVAQLHKQTYKVEDASKLAAVIIPYEKLLKGDGSRLIAAGDLPPPPVAATAELPEPKVAPSVQASFYRCLYAGFVVKSDPCTGPSALPGDFGLKDVNGETFRCASDKSICNPLLYGVKTEGCELDPAKPDSENRACLAKASPLCIQKTKSASEDCGLASRADGALRSAAAVIKLNEAAYTSYRRSFYELCDDRLVQLNGLSYVKNGESRSNAEEMKNDLDQTCALARTRLKDLAAKYGVTLDRPKTVNEATVPGKR